MKLLPALLLSGLITVAACKKEDKKPAEPLPSQTGANIAWCMINGEPRTYKGKKEHPVGMGFSLGSAKEKDEDIDFYFTQYHGQEFDMTLEKKDPQNELNIIICDSVAIEVNKKYTIHNSRPRQSSMYQTYERGLISGSFYADESRSYVIFTRLDDVVIAGKFEFHGFDADTNYVQLTEGFFDIER